MVESELLLSRSSDNNPDEEPLHFEGEVSEEAILEILLATQKEKLENFKDK